MQTEMGTMELAGFGAVVNGVLGKSFSSRSGEPSKDIEQERGMVRFAFCARESWDSQVRGRLERGGGNTGSSPWRDGG